MASTPRIQKEVIKPSNTKSTPAPAPIPVHQAKHKKGHDDDYDDDFEDYNDDFENDDSEGVQQKSRQSASPAKESPAKRILAEKTAALSLAAESKKSGGSKSNDSNSSRKESSHKSSSKKSSDPLGSSGAIKRIKKFATMSLSTAGDASADPRALRVAKLREMNIFDMQVEVFSNQLSLVPGSPYEMYLRLLRAPNSNLKQMGVPVNEETIDHEMQTDEIITSDKQIQFSYGDDTSLLNIMSTVKSRSLMFKKGIKPVETLLEQVDREFGSHNRDKHSTFAFSSMSKVDNSSSLNFTSFLQRSSQLCIALLEEKRLALSDKSSGSKSHTEQIFSPEHAWESLGEEKDQVDGANMFLSTRRTSTLRFSSIQPHVIITAHPYPIDDDTDLRPSTGLYAIWDVAVTSFPSWLLCGRGQPTTCCMSGAQTYIALAGTEAGVLHLWDLRESASIHQDSDSLAMKIMRGIRKPCYSTPCHASEGKDIDTTSQHCHPIVQVEPLGSSTSEWASVVSQFASIDRSGLTILWMTAQDSITQKDGDGRQDFGLAPWSGLKLVRNRVLSDQGPARGSHLKSHITGWQSTPIFCSIPNDRSTFILSTGGGQVSKLTRYGDTPTPRCYYNPPTGEVEVQYSDDGRGDGVLETKVDPYQADVTSLSVGRGVGEMYLILVGRRNGVVDLFQSNESAPIQTWNMAAFKRSDGKKVDSLSPPAVIMARWLPAQLSSFLVVDELGECNLFNLIKDPYNPILNDNIGIGHIHSSSSIDLSECRSGSSIVRVVVIDDKATVADKSIRIRKLWAGLFSHKLSLADEEEELHASMSAWVGRNVQENVVQVFKNVSNRK